jgi:hypothetical protein
MKKSIFYVSLTLLLLLSACGGRPADEKENIAAPVDGNSASVSSPQEGVWPVPTVYDKTKPLADDEFVLYNGVHFGMTYEAVLAVTGADVTFYPNDWGDSKSIGQDGVSYGFQQNAEDNEFYLVSLNIQNGTDHGEVVAPIFRGINIGDTMESVFDKFPVRDRELKQWAYQELYGEPPANYSFLEYVAGSYYSMRLVADTCWANITFSRLEQKVLWVELYGEIL